MACRITTRSLPHRWHPVRSFLRYSRHSRSFITLPVAEPIFLQESRILPYNAQTLYSIVADVDSYSAFLPYCQESKVTKWSSPDNDGRRWPERADLKVGWGGYEEKFTSRLFCVPGRIVEALGGEAQTTLNMSDLKHHSASVGVPSSSNTIFKTLSTRWVIDPFPYNKPSSRQPETDRAIHPARDLTKVNLTIEFQFVNPIYAALSKAVAPKVAAIMIEAFEKRARNLLDGPAAVARGSTIPLSQKASM